MLLQHLSEWAVIQYPVKVLKASLVINDQIPIGYEVCNTFWLSTGYYCNICSKALNPAHDLNDVLLFAFSNCSWSLSIKFDASRLLGGGLVILMKWPSWIRQTSFLGMGDSPSAMYKGCVVKAVMLILLAGCCQMVPDNWLTWLSWSTIEIGSWLHSSAALVWHNHPPLPPQLVFLLHQDPDEYHRHLWCQPPASQFCMSFLVSPWWWRHFVQETCRPSHHCAVSWLFLWGWLRCLSKGHKLFIDSSSSDCPITRWSIGCSRKFLSGCFTLAATYSQC